MRFATTAKCDVPIWTLAFRFPDRPEETWTRRFNEFKYGSPTLQDAAVQGACSAISAALGSIRIPGPVAMLAAISSEDTVLDEASPVSRLGRSCAAARRWSWEPGAIGKNVHRPLHLLKTAKERDEEVRSAYRVDPLAVATVVILDDFVTSGSTMSEIARAIRSAMSRVLVVGLALGKNERADYWADRNVALNNDHVSETCNRNWGKGSQ